MRPWFRTAVLLTLIAGASVRTAAAGDPVAVCFAPGTPAEVVQQATAAAAATHSSLALGPPSEEGLPQAFQVDGRWTSTSTNGSIPTRGTPLTLTWRVVNDGTAISGTAVTGESTGPSNLRARLNALYGSEGVWVPILQQIFDRWSQITGVDYVLAANDDGAAMGNGGAAGLAGVRADIRLGGRTLDGNGGVLAYNYFPNNGDMIVDTADSFYDDTSNGSLKLRNVLAHEHGHGLGLSHSCPVNQTKLMEPFVSTAFDGPQLDDRLGAQRNYGDTLEANDTTGTATNLGTLGSSFSVANTSLDGTDDPDVFSWFLSTTKQVSFTVTPAGLSYPSGPQNGDGSCSAGSAFDSRLQNDVSLQLLAGNGNVLFSANAGGAGTAETIGPVVLSPGTYYVRALPGGVDAVQPYGLAATATAAAVSISIADPAPLAEGHSGLKTMTFNVTLSAATDHPVSASFTTTNNTAVAGSDYLATSGTVTIPAGALTATISVSLNGDLIAEPDETFFVDLTNPVGATISKARGVGTIVNDDFPSVTLGDVQVLEGVSGGLAGVPLTLSSPSSTDVTVTLATTSGTAVAGLDFTATTGSVVIPAGSTSGTFFVPITVDLIVEPDETFTVSATSSTVPVARGTATVTILNDDHALACTVIATLPYTITAQGRYCLSTNLSTAITAGAAITINSDFVVLDLRGFKIGGGSAGPGTAAHGVYALNRRNITVKNGNIRGFLRGVYLQDTSGNFSASQGHLIERLLVDGNTEAGIWVEGRGNVVRRNQVASTVATGTGPSLTIDAYGICMFGAGARILDNDVTDTVGFPAQVPGKGTAMLLFSANGAVVERNRVSNATLSSYGVRVLSGTSVLVLNNRLSVVEFGVVYEPGTTGKYKGNLTSGVTTPFTGGTDAGGNN